MFNVQSLNFRLVFVTEKYLPI